MTRAQRLQKIIAGVVHQAIADAHADALVVIDDGQADAALLATWLEEAGLSVPVRRMPALQAGSLRRAGTPTAAGGTSGTGEPRAALVAHPANKTSLLLDGVPDAALLPFGDLWASQVEALGAAVIPGDGSGRLAGELGGLAVLDTVLERLVDDRQAPAQALAGFDEPVRGTLLALLARTRYARQRAGLVPKLSARTIGVDLFD